MRESSRRRVRGDRRLCPSWGDQQITGVAEAQTASGEFQRMGSFYTRKRLRCNVKAWVFK